MRYELSDYEWTAIKPMLPNKPRGVRRVIDRRVLNGIFWVLRSGAPWRDLPEIAAAGYSLEDTVFARIYLSHFERDYDGLNRAYYRFFTDDAKVPSRTTTPTSSRRSIRTMRNFGAVRRRAARVSRPRPGSAMARSAPIRVARSACRASPTA